MKEISRIASKVRASTTLAVDAKAKQLKAEGYDVIGFGAGEPDFDTPDHIKAAGIRAINEGKTKYTPAAGLIELRKAVANRMKAETGVEYDFSQIVIASGAKHSVYATLCCLLNPEDEVILAAPYWVSYYEMVNMAGGTAVTITATEAQNFKVTPEQLEGAITDKTKVFMLNNPSNPTGMIYSKEELVAIAEVCKKHDIYVISDEIYLNLVYDNMEFVSFASISEDAYARTIVINGVSKSYSMTGWRIGYSACNKELAKVLGNFLSHSTGAPGTMNQLAAVEAYNADQSMLQDMKKVFEERRNYIVERVNSIEGVSCIKPNGAFYVMMNLEKIIGKTLGGKLIENDDDFAIALLDKALVAVVPCSGFGAPNFVRFTYATSMENIKNGLDRLEKFLKGE